MKRFVTLLTIALTVLAVFATSAEARRFGGGTSIGKQRTMSAPAQRTPSAAPAPAAPAQPAPAPQPAGNRWLGPLAGLAIGAGLGALLGSSGLGAGMGSFVALFLAGIAIMLLISAFARRTSQPAVQYAGPAVPTGGTNDTELQPSNAAAPPASGIPADFPVESFLRNAKTSFIRLQAANDRKDLDDIREYTTPEIFAEISMQIRERGDAAQKTDVISVGADLLEVVTEGKHAIASVRLTGLISENQGSSEKFDEVWHMQKNLGDEKSVWLLAGIQQI